MTSDQLRAVLGRLGWSQSGAARRLSIAEVRMRRYAAGLWPVPPWLSLCLGLIEAIPSAKQWIEDRYQEAGRRAGGQPDHGGHTDTV